MWNIEWNIESKYFALLTLINCGIKSNWDGESDVEGFGIDLPRLSLNRIE